MTSVRATSVVSARNDLWLLENGRAPLLIDTGMSVVNGPAFTPGVRALPATPLPMPFRCPTLA